MPTLSREFRGHGKRELKPRDYAIFALKQMQRRDSNHIKERIALATMGIKDLSFARMLFETPSDHHKMLQIIYPDMCSRDAKEKTNFLTKVAPKLELFKPYLINPKQQMKGVCHGG